MQQKVHHVGLGKELGDGGQLVGANLHFRGVDLVFALGLPELVHPAQAVAGLEHVGRQRGQQALQLTLVLGGEGQLKHRALRLEHLGQHARGQLAGQLPPGFGAQVHGGVGFLHQGFAVVQRHGGAGLPQQQAVFGQEAGEQHAVPVLVSYFPHQLLHGLGVVQGFGIAQCAAMGAQAAAQGFVVVAQVVGCPALGHSQLGQCGAGAFLGHLARGFDGVFELGALGFGQGGVVCCHARDKVSCVFNSGSMARQERRCSSVGG